MRDRVMVRLGGQEYSLLPTFAVWDEFEDATGVSLMQHLDDLYNLRAVANVRARLLLLGLKAGEPDVKFTMERVKQAMFDRGAWHKDMVGIEADFAHRLLYTPEQYVEKKRELEEAEKARREAMTQLGAFSDPFSDSPLPI